MNQPAKNFSDLHLATERLHLRGPRTSDAEAILGMRKRPEVMRYGSSGVWTMLSQAQERIARDISGMAAGESLRLALVPIGQEELIGTCSLFQLDYQSRRAEIGYELHPDYWHKGYMQEALHALLAYAFSVLELNRLEADIHPDNLASARLLEKLGFVREGLLRERWIVEGEISDTVMYGLLAREWQQQS